MSTFLLPSSACPSFHNDIERGSLETQTALNPKRGPFSERHRRSSASSLSTADAQSFTGSGPASTRASSADDDNLTATPKPAFITGIQSINVPPPQATLYPLPEKSEPRLLRNVRWLIFTAYRCLFTIAFVTNAAALVALSAADRLTFSTTATAASVNLVVSVLMRQEHVINLLFLLSSCLPLWLPLWLRCRVAKIYCYGGLHSGCGVAAAVWYIAFTAYLTQETVRAPAFWPATGMAFAVLAFLIIIVGFAHPTLRMKMHDNFEASHRFAGWLVVALYWAQTMILVDRQHVLSQGTKSFRDVLVNTPSFWCVCIITACLFYPWIRLRKRTVYVEKLSNHAARLHFTHTQLDRCLGVRLSTNPLFESHAFATIPAADPRKGFSCVISHAGDWTRRIIREPGLRTKIWMKGAPTYGVLRTALIFKRTVLVATGSGIGPCLSLLNANEGIDCRVLWSTKSPRTTYGDEIVRAVLRADPSAIIHDTGTEGRPDMVSMTYQLYKQSGAEAIFLISNPTVTRQVIYGMEARGIPAFAPIFDS